MRISLLAVAATALLLTACGSEVAGPGGASSSVNGGNTAPTADSTPSADGETGTSPGNPGALFASATVLEAPGKGPQLCLGGIATSLPPQCGGPLITNWEWAKAPTPEEAAGVRWGQYVIVGTYAAEANTFKLTRDPVTPEAYTGPKPSAPEDPSFTTPCPVPEGGWQVVDPAKTTQAAQDAMLEAATRLAGYAGAWLDQSINPADPDKQPEAMNDPVKMIINVRVTHDAAAAEQELRKLWGGMLCVSAGGKPEADLLRIQMEVSTNKTVLTSSANGPEGFVDVEVIYDDGTLQRELDTTYGPGTVRVHSRLQPYPG